MVLGVTENPTPLVFAAREGGGACSRQEQNEKPSPTHVCSERGWCLLVVPILIAPCFHPMSSCSWQQLGVLSWWWSSGPPCHPALIVIVVLPSSSSLSSSCPRHHCHHPALIIILLLPLSCTCCHRCLPAQVVIIILPLLSCCHHHHSTHYPPHEQLLVDMGQYKGTTLQV